MMDEILSVDPTRATVVKIGRFQESPLVNNVYVSISGGDQQDPYLNDGVLDVRSTTPGWQPGFQMPTYEVGGDPNFNGMSNRMWWRRGKIELGCFYVQQQFEEELAAQYAYETLGRLIKAVETCPVSGVKDTFNECAVAIFCFASSFFESGGPPKQYIWRGAVKWQVLTERS
jgi:hypothetical protein